MAALADIANYITSVSLSGGPKVSVEDLILETAFLLRTDFFSLKNNLKII